MYRKRIKSARLETGSMVVETDHESVQMALRPILMIARFIGILPIDGVDHRDQSKLSFSYGNLKVAGTIILISCSVFITLLTWIEIAEEGLKSIYVDNIFFYGSSALSTMCFFNLSSKWPHLMQEWAAVENAMKHYKPVKFTRKIKYFTIYVLIMSLCEHFLAISHVYVHLNKEFSEANKIEQYLRKTFVQVVFNTISYSLWKAILMAVFRLMTTIAWNMNDLFLTATFMSMSYLNKRFSLEMQSVIHQDMPLEYWRSVRITYNKMSLLVKLVNKRLSSFLILSFASNLYFICFQFLKSMNSSTQFDPVLVAYYAFSFWHLLFRTLAVSMAAAEIYENGRDSLKTFFSVSSQNYNDEVHRIIFQMSCDRLSITAFNFFSLSRGFVLTVAGTIITYEAVLVQFNALSKSSDV